MIFKINYLFKAKFLVPVILLYVLTSLDAQVSQVSNLSQYVFPDFTESVVKMKNGNSRSLALNYNFITERMVYIENNQFFDLVNSDMVDTVYINNRKFVPYEGTFYEVLLTGDVPLFLQYTGQLADLGKDAGYGTTSQTTSISNISGMYSNKAVLNLKLPDNVRVQEYKNYWLRKEDKMITFKNRKQFLEIFPDQENKLDDFIKSDKTKFNSNEDLVSLLRYTNTLF